MTGVFLVLQKVHRNLDIPEKTLSNINCFVLITHNSHYCYKYTEAHQTPLIKILNDDYSALATLHTSQWETKGGQMVINSTLHSTVKTEGWNVLSLWRIKYSRLSHNNSPVLYIGQVLTN